MIPCQCKCGHSIYTSIAIVLKCSKCARRVECDGVERPRKSESKPNSPKPGAWVHLVRFLRSPSDTGVGDTVQRIAAKFGGERFKKWANKIGIPCGCDKRQAEWNRLYPY